MNWIEPEEITSARGIENVIGGHPLLAKRIVQLGISQPKAALEFLNPELYQPADAQELPGIKETADRIEQAFAKEESILVWGDFDVDGQTATALLVSLMRIFSNKVNFYVPLREIESHGIHLPKLRQLLGDEYKILITCDTGISAVNEVDELNKLGVETLITDHHELPEVLPSAKALVNPHFLPEAHPMIGLPGVGVAFQVAREILRRAGKPGLEESFLDLVALGTIADLARLRGDVRYLVQAGLRTIRQGNRIGLKALYERLEFDPSEMTEDHISYLIAPRLNAMGRLGDANPAVELLLTDDPGRARVLVSEIESLNARRRLLSNSIYQGIEAQIQNKPSLLDVPVLVFESHEWSAGVIGIVASRIVEQYGKPAILITTEGGEFSRGSARSTNEVNITEGLANVKDLLRSFGGHPMAAGFSLPTEKISEFKRRLSRQIEQLPVAPQSGLVIDGYVPLSNLSLDLVKDFDRLAPFGPGNPPLILAAKKIRISGHSKMGRDEEHLRISVYEEETNHTQNLLWWHGNEIRLPDGFFDLAYRVRVNQYAGRDEVLVEWVDFRQSEYDRLEITQKHSPLIVDYRKEPHPIVLLRALLPEGELQIWAEGEVTKKLAASGIKSYTRMEIKPCKILIIFSIPPGPFELKDTIHKTNPKRIFLFAEDPQADQMEGFTKKLTGVIKYAIRNLNGQISLYQMSALTAQRNTTVKAGLDWLNSNGYIEVVKVKEDEVIVSIGDGNSNPDQVKKKTAALKMSMDETRAFRLFYVNASEEGIKALCNS